MAPETTKTNGGTMEATDEIQAEETIRDKVKNGEMVPQAALAAILKKAAYNKKMKEDRIARKKYRRAVAKYLLTFKFLRKK